MFNNHNFFFRISKPTEFNFNKNIQWVVFFASFNGQTHDSETNFGKKTQDFDIISESDNTFQKYVPAINSLRPSDAYMHR